MPGTTKPVTEDNWLPKARAAKLLGASARQLERRTAQGFISKHIGVRKPTDRNAPVFYSRADILALKAGTPNEYAREVTEPAPVSNDAAAAAPPAKPTTALAVRRASAGVDPFAALLAHLASLQPAAAPVVKPWLTLPEAVEYSGLPSAWLVAAAREGRLRAINVGTGAREFWRFNREALAK